MVAIVTSLLAATVVRANDAPAAIAPGPGQVEAAPEESRAVPNPMLPFPKRVHPGVLINDLDLLGTPPNDYWVGVIVSRPSPALRAQLRVPKDQGLVVDVLEPEGPAAKAGLQLYDVLLKGNDKPLAHVQDLMQIVGQVKDGKLTFDLIRAGKQETVSITPVHRPAHMPGAPSGPRLPAPVAPNGLSWNVDPNGLLGGPLQFQIIRPGLILPPGSPVMNLPGGGVTTMDITVHAKANLADGSKVEITRHGDEPAKVVVTHDKEKWEGTSGDLSQIPDKIRPEVQELLHPAFDRLRVFSGPAGGGMVGSTTADGGSMTGTGSTAGAVPVNAMVALSKLENRLLDMQKQIDELRRSVDALRSEAKQKPAANP